MSSHLFLQVEPLVVGQWLGCLGCQVISTVAWGLTPEQASGQLRGSHHVHGGQLQARAGGLQALLTGALLVQSLTNSTLALLL